MRKAIGITVLIIVLSATAYAQTEMIVTYVLQGKIISAGGMSFEAKRTCVVDVGDIIAFSGPTHNCHTTVFYNKSKGNTCVVYCNKN